MLALGYSELGKHAEFMNYAMASASTMESTHDSASAGFFYKRIADMYLEIGGARGRNPPSGL